MCVGGAGAWKSFSGVNDAFNELCIPSEVREQSVTAGMICGADVQRNK